MPASLSAADRKRDENKEALDIDQESAATKKLYGIDNPATQGFSRNCLMARRLLERGVRFVQVLNGGAFGSGATAQAPLAGGGLGLFGGELADHVSLGL